MGRKRVAAYSRVSTMYEHQIQSLENQIDVFTEKIRKNPEWEFAGVYADLALTGTREDRRGFEKMVRDARAKRFDFLLAKSISRFARNTLTGIQTAREFRKMGIGILFEEENLNTLDPGAEMILTILFAFAQEESRNISERVRSGIAMGWANGKTQWVPLYGYCREGEAAYRVSAREADVVRRIFDEYTAGRRVADICAGLNGEGIKSPRGGKWTSCAVDQMLRNERYTGDVLTGKRYCEDFLTHRMRVNRGEMRQVLIREHHEGIISREEFSLAQEIRDLRREGKYPWADLLVCPACGKALERKSAGWACSCERFYIPQKNLSAAVLAAAAEAGKPRESAEYAWLKAEAEKITFSPNGYALTVHWKRGGSTPVETRFQRMNTALGSMFRRGRKLREGMTQKKPARKRVVRVAGRG